MSPLKVLTIIALTSLVPEGFSFASGPAVGIPVLDAVNRHDNIIAVRIRSGEIIRTQDGHECGNYYVGDVLNELKGHVGSKGISFVSSHGFGIGRKFIVFLMQQQPYSNGEEHEIVSREKRQLAKQCYEVAEELRIDHTTSIRPISLEVAVSAVGATKQWLEFDPLNLQVPPDRFDVQPEIIRSCDEAGKRCSVIRRRELVSLESFQEQIQPSPSRPPKGH